MPGPSFYAALAKSILAGHVSADAIVARLSFTLGREWRWLRPLVRRYHAKFGQGTRPRSRDVAKFLDQDSGLARALHLYRNQIQIAAWVTPSQQMQPAPTARGWPIPPLESVGELADWLHISPGELLWFADLKRMIARRGPEAATGPLSHYHYRVLAKDGGSVRLIEAPKQRLKLIQKQILNEILERIPVHPAAHGFRRGRSIKTFTAPHAGQNVVVRMDLRDFFPSISAPRVQAMFRTAGYPEAVANLLGGLCTNAVPRAIWTCRGLDPLCIAEARQLYAWPHLPQGAPTSPALANVCTHRVDCRLTGLAEASGAVYTRYADDLAFSGGAKFERSAQRFAIHAAAILLEEGFAVHHRKTRIMRQGVRQYLAGIVANQHLNVIRSDFDTLKAILTNSIRHGKNSQNREDHVDFRMHLQGRVSFVEMVNAKRGAKLRRIFEQIQW
ncbi:MAG TPA: reverse transcriptase family protein [Terracidiphilus sp.]